MSIQQSPVQEQEQSTAIAAPTRVPVQLGVAPTNVEEGWRLATMMAKSQMVPKAFQGKPEDILVAIQAGIELGLAPFQSLQSFAVINSRPTLFGDGFLAVLMAAPSYQNHEEFYEVGDQRRDVLNADDIKLDATTAVCSFWRKGKPTPVTRRFSVAQAKLAGLFTKEGPWKQYPARMLSMRARSWAGRDCFPDVLRGMTTAEEAMDIPPEESAPAEAPREVRRISETAAAPAGPHVINVPKVEEAMLDPQTVKDVEQFSGGYVLTLGNGVRVDVDNDADALELEKFKGTSHLLRCSVEKLGAVLRLKSYAIHD